LKLCQGIKQQHGGVPIIRINAVVEALQRSAKINDCLQSSRFFFFSVPISSLSKVETCIQEVRCGAAAEAINFDATTDRLIIDILLKDTSPFKLFDALINGNAGTRPIISLAGGNENVKNVPHTMQSVPCKLWIC
jgi:hypothetical protein